MNIVDNFINKFGKNFSENVNLFLFYSWFNLGGNADFFYKAPDVNQLKEFLRESKEKNLKTIILGAGSNTLFRDKGVKGAVIKLRKEFSYYKIIEKHFRGRSSHIRSKSS